MSGQEVLPPQSDAAAPSEPGHGGSAMPTILLSVLSVLVLFGVLGGVAFGIMLFGGFGSQRPDFLTWSEPAVPDPNYVAEPKLTEFTLIERSGESFESKSLKGKVWVASFFYAKCSHKCFQLNQSVQRLEQQFGDRDVTFVSITCDPKNDTPEALRQYADRFEADEKQWLFLTGDMDYIGRIGQDMFSAVVAQETHSNSVFIVDKQGHMRGRYNALDQNGLLGAQTLIKKLIDEPYEPRVGETEEPSESAGS